MLSEAVWFLDRWCRLGLASFGDERIGSTSTRHSECDCPEWVVMCVHLPSGERLMLTVSDVHQCKCIDEAVGFQAVISSNAPFEVCTLCGTGARLWNREITVIGRFHDRAEAEAAFRAEEQRIIREVFGHA